jgi:hypothetical protein
LPSELADPDAAGSALVCSDMVPVNEVTPLAVCAASLTVFSGVSGAADLPGAVGSPLLEGTAGPQPERPAARNAAVIAASTAYRGRRVAHARTKNLPGPTLTRCAASKEDFDPLPLKTARRPAPTSALDIDRIHSNELARLDMR